LHSGDQRAGVGAVVRASAQDGGGVHVWIVHGLHHSNHMQILVMLEEIVESISTGY
jgi:hypothetical protein